jgi:uracil-DNA glycosylase
VKSNEEQREDWMKGNSGWGSILESPQCREVLERVDALRKKGERVYPIQKDVFRAFEDCPFEKVRAVILGQDPYPNKGQAIGLAFAVPEQTKSTEVPRSLKNIFKELEREYKHLSMPKPTLESWAKQGVFLLNTALTVECGRSGSHATIGWKNAVTIPTLKKLSAERKNLVFMLWGNHAKKFDRFLDPLGHLVLKASHPSPRSAAKGADHFQECNHFCKANDYLSKHGIEPIIWTDGK